MTVIDKEGNVIREQSHPRPACVWSGTVRVKSSDNRVRKPYKVVSKEEFDAGLY